MFGGNYRNQPGGPGAMGAGMTATNQGMNAGASGNTNMSGGFDWGNHGGDSFRRFGDARPMGFGGGFGAGGMGARFGGFGGMGGGFGGLMSNLASRFPQFGLGNNQPPQGPGVPQQAQPMQHAGMPVPGMTPQQPPAWGQGGNIQGLLAQLFPQGFPGQGQGPMG